MFGKYEKLVNSVNSKKCTKLARSWLSNALNYKILEDEEFSYKFINVFVCYVSADEEYYLLKEIKEINTDVYYDEYGGFVLISFEKANDVLYCSKMMLIEKNCEKTVVQRIFFGDGDDIEANNLDYLFKNHKSLNNGKLNNLEDAIKIYNDLE